MTTQVAVITLADVPPVELAGGSWSRVLVADKTVGEARSEAHRLVGDARHEAEVTTTAARREVEELTRQKDAVTAQLGQMLSGLAGIVPSVTAAAANKNEKKSGQDDKVSAG